jgi:hypothetical protein
LFPVKIKTKVVRSCACSLGLLHRLRVIHIYGSLEFTPCCLYICKSMDCVIVFPFGFLTGSGCLPEGAYASKLRCPVFRHCDHYVRALV